MSKGRKRRSEQTPQGVALRLAPTGRRVNRASAVFLLIRLANLEERSVRPRLRQTPAIVAGSGRRVNHTR